MAAYQDLFATIFVVTATVDDFPLSEVSSEERRPPLSKFPGVRRRPQLGEEPHYLTVSILCFVKMRKCTTRLQVVNNSDMRAETKNRKVSRSLREISSRSLKFGLMMSWSEGTFLTGAPSSRATQLRLKIWLHLRDTTLPQLAMLPWVPLLSSNRRVFELCKLKCVARHFHNQLHRERHLVSSPGR